MVSGSPGPRAATPARGAPAFEIRQVSGRDRSQRPGRFCPAGGDPAGLPGPVFDRLRNTLETLAEEIAADSGCSLNLTFSEGYPAVWNPPELLAQVEALWPLTRMDRPVLITEDFSWYQRYLPGLFFFLGCGPAPALHSPGFQFDEGVLSRGVDLFARIAEEFV